MYINEFFFPKKQHLIIVDILFMVFYFDFNSDRCRFRLAITKERGHLVLAYSAPILSLPAFVFVTFPTNIFIHEALFLKGYGKKDQDRDFDKKEKGDISYLEDMNVLFKNFLIKPVLFWKLRGFKQRFKPNMLRLPAPRGWIIGGNFHCFFRVIFTLETTLKTTQKNTPKTTLKTI